MNVSGMGGWSQAAARSPAETAGPIRDLPIDDPESARHLLLLREALEGVNVGIWQADHDTGLICWDAVGSALLGVGAGPRIGEPSLPAHPDDRAMVAERLHDCLRSGGLLDIEFQVMRDGAPVWLRAIGSPGRDRQSGSGAVMGVLADITRRKLAEAGLRESRRQITTLIDNLPGIVYSAGIRAPWPVRYISDGVAALTGYPAEQWLDGRINWGKVIHPDDLDRVEREVATAIAEDRHFELQYRLLHHSGEVRWVHERGRASARDADDARVIEGFVADITGRKRTQAALEASEQRFQSILDHLPQMVWSARPNGHHDYYSRQWYEFTATEPGDTEGDGWNDLLHPDDRERAWTAWRRSLETGEPYEIEYRLRHCSGRYVWALARARAERGPDGSIVRWHGTCTDIDQGVLAKQALNASEALNRSIVEASTDCIKLLDLSGRLLFINGSGVRAMEVACESSLTGGKWVEWFEPGIRRQLRRALALARRGGIGRTTVMQPVPSGATKWWDIVATPVPDEKGKPFRILVISRDITEQKRIEDRVRWTADHDSLTGLANRALFQQRLGAFIAHAGENGGTFGLMLLDLDDFKRTNDTLGHDAGDALLRGFADRLREAARPDDLVARLGGDEFAVILNGAAGEDCVRSAAAAIYDRLREPCIHGARILDCQATIGASLFPRHGADRAELMKHADIALYVAKSTGKGGLELFRPAMRAEMQKRLSMLALARSALNEHRIAPFYQPKVDLGSGRLAGFEALLRWHHPSRGPQTPETIAAAFDDLTLAAEISDRMIDLVIADVQGWLRAGVPFGHVAINAAAAEFRRGDFAERLLARLRDAGIAPSRLQLEVTETVFLGRGAEYVERALKTLSKAGVQIALDDFGTGYASLSHLKRFPVDVIKIDRSFISDVHQESSDDAAIVRAVINLGRSLDIDIVAEGVETPVQASLLAAQGCDYGQGFLYGRAAPAREVADLIRDWRKDAAGGGAGNWPLRLAS